MHMKINKETKIEFATTDQLDSLRSIANQFMRVIFDFEPRDYLISDESSLSDFRGFKQNGLAELWEQIETHYGIGKESVQSDRLVDIFKVISENPTTLG